MIVKKKTKLFLCISQVDSASKGLPRDFIETDFYLFKNGKGISRVWDFKKDQNMIYCYSDINSKQTTKKIRREIWGQVTLDVPENKKSQSYTLVCNMNYPKANPTDVPFFVKLFSDSEMVFEPLEQALEYMIEDTWENQEFGGFTFQGEKSDTVNPYWCHNPQYLINITQPVSLKIILIKTGKNAKKYRNAKIGITFLYLHGDKKIDFYMNDRPEYQNTKNQKDQAIFKNFKKFEKYLSIPKLETFQQKLRLHKEDNFIHTSFANTE